MSGSSPNPQVTYEQELRLLQKYEYMRSPIYTGGIPDAPGSERTTEMQPHTKRGTSVTNSPSWHDRALMLSLETRGKTCESQAQPQRYLVETAHETHVEANLPECMRGAPEEPESRRRYPSGRHFASQNGAPGTNRRPRRPIGHHGAPQVRFFTFFRNLGSLWGAILEPLAPLLSLKSAKVPPESTPRETIGIWARKVRRNGRCQGSPTPTKHCPYKQKPRFSTFTPCPL